MLHAYLNLFTQINYVKVSLVIYCQNETLLLNAYGSTVVKKKVF